MRSHIYKFSLLLFMCRGIFEQVFTSVVVKVSSVFHLWWVYRSLPTYLFIPHHVGMFSNKSVIFLTLRLRTTLCVLGTFIERLIFVSGVSVLTGLIRLDISVFHPNTDRQSPTRPPLSLTIPFQRDVPLLYRVLIHHCYHGDTQTCLGQ